MATTRPALRPEHRRMFRAYVCLVHDLDQHRFLQQCRQQSHTVSCQPDANGEPQTTAPDYDWDDFRSFMTDFRKMAMLEKERTYLPKVFNQVGRYASDELRKRLKAVHKEMAATVKGTWTGMHLGAQVEGNDVTFSTAQLLDIMTNGMIFHQDARHDQAVELFAKDPRWVYLWPALHFKVFPILRHAFALSQELWRDGILPETDYPEEWQAARRAWEASQAAALTA